MIDTINISMDKLDIDGDIDLVSEIGARIKVNAYKSNEYKVEGHLGNLKVEVTNMKIRIYGSVAKYLKEDNLETLSLEELKRAVEKLENELGIPVHKGKITRVDLAGTFQMKRKSLLYLKKLGCLNGFIRSSFTDDTLCYTRKREIQLCFYDKAKEMRDKGVLVDVDNLLRYEYRIYHKGILRLFKRNLRVEELRDKEVFNVLLSEWYNAYSSILKIGSDCLDVSFNSLEKASDWIALCVCQVNNEKDVIGALKHAFACRERKMLGDISLHDRLKRATLKMLERGKRFAKPDNLITELTALIDRCYKEHLI